MFISLNLERISALKFLLGFLLILMALDIFPKIKVEDAFGLMALLLNEADLLLSQIWRLYHFCSPHSIVEETESDINGSAQVSNTKHHQHLM
ncbi:hypothetical protein MKX03_004670 [Papaver bracteatum]|nr:hypothetical protein MKX03_004670 [Papaver bracteatum]